MTNNKQLVDTFIQELFTKGDMDAVDRYLDPQYVNHDLPFPRRARRAGGDASGRGVVPAGTARLAQRGRAADRRGRHRRRTFTASGTHTAAPLMGGPPTGKTITVAGINIFRVNSDRIVERWGRLDEAGLLRQLGLITG